MTTEELTPDANPTEELAQPALVEEPTPAPPADAEPVQGLELGAAGDPPVLIEPRETEEPSAEDGVDVLTPTCGCTPAGCSWDLCEESWPEVGEPLVIEAEELEEVEVEIRPDMYGVAPDYDVVLPPFEVESAEASVPGSSPPAVLAETGAPVDGWVLLVVGAVLVFGGAAVAVSRWIGARR